MRDDWIPFESERQKWVEEAEGFERLRRMWLWESKAMRLDPEKPTPKEVSERRWADFWQMWSLVTSRAPKKTAPIGPEMPQEAFSGSTPGPTIHEAPRAAISEVEDLEEAPF